MLSCVVNSIQLKGRPASLWSFPQRRVFSDHSFEVDREREKEKGGNELTIGLTETSYEPTYNNQPWFYVLIISEISSKLFSNKLWRAIFGFFLPRGPQMNKYLSNKQTLYPCTLVLFPTTYLPRRDLLLSRHDWTKVFEKLAHVFRATSETMDWTYHYSNKRKILKAFMWVFWLSNRQDILLELLLPTCGRPEASLFTNSVHQQCKASSIGECLQPSQSVHSLETKLQNCFQPKTEQ